MIGDANDEINFPKKLVLTNTQIFSLRKTLRNNTSADINL